ncbi:AraC family transcriptional regulator [Sphingobium estronivorans]|uniref:AraC family transcriptional regulator n=1 Tax=Sphingobium estronivorans TaxID=1577690 RepID=UPI00123B3EB8|nr:AraC family transcriptional regulator [Sphingobium estronivorans]
MTVHGSEEGAAPVSMPSAWSEERLATTVIEGAVIRLCEPVGGRFAERLRGREATHQIGFWTSETHRPRGLFRYGNSGGFAPIQRISYVPADIEWRAEISDHKPVRPALYCDFDKAYFRDLVGVETDDNPQHLRACLSVSGPVITQALSLLLGEVRNPGFSHDIAVDALCRVMLVELGRHLRHARRDETGGGSSPLARWQVDRIRQYVEAVEGRPVVIGELADICDISGSHLRRVFKATTGMSVGAFVDHIRLERAKTLLRDDRQPLKQIAHLLGFSNPSAFSTAFRRGTGVTPRTFRQMAVSAGTGSASRP